MKFKIAILACLLFPMVSVADSSSVVGRYSMCVVWTEMNGVESSKSFEFSVKDDQSISFDAKFYIGSSYCVGNSQPILHAKNFQIMSQIGKFPDVYEMTLKDLDGSGYYEVYLDGSQVLIENGDALPMQYDFSRSYHLIKQQ